MEVRVWPVPPPFIHVFTYSSSTCPRHQHQASHPFHPRTQWLSTVKDDISLIWHAGDVGYADDSFLHAGCMAHFCYEKVWDEYMAQMQEAAGVASIPWMVCLGRACGSCTSPFISSCPFSPSACRASGYTRQSRGGLPRSRVLPVQGIPPKFVEFLCLQRGERGPCWVSHLTTPAPLTHSRSLAFQRFKMPSEPTGGNSNMWYSFNAGPVHFVSLDLETAYPGAAEESRYIFPSGG